MDIASAVLWVAGGLVALILLLFMFAIFVVGCVLLIKWFGRKAEAAGVNFSDGIDAKEREILLGFLKSHRETKVEQQVAIDIINAAQANLQKSKPTAD